MPKIVSAEAEQAKPQPVADRRALGEVAARLDAGLVKVFQLGSRKFELAGRFQADRAVIGSEQRDDVAILDDRLPVECREAHQQVADSAGFVIGGRAVVGRAENKLLVLGADPPILLWLLPGREGREQIVAALDWRAFAVVRPSGHLQRP